MKISTKYGDIENVPQITWKEFEPYWVATVISIAEVITEHSFRPYPASFSRPDGIVVTSGYWDDFTDEETFPFPQALLFIKLLKEKPLFHESIRNFNQNTTSDWLLPENIPLLGNRIYGFVHILKPLLVVHAAIEGPIIKVKFNRTKL